MPGSPGISGCCPAGLPYIFLSAKNPAAVIQPPGKKQFPCWEHTPGVSQTHCSVNTKKRQVPCIPWLAKFSTLSFVTPLQTLLLWRQKYGLYKQKPPYILPYALILFKWHFHMLVSFGTGTTSYNFPCQSI